MKKIARFFLILSLFASCGKKQVATPASLKKTVLLLPLNNAACVSDVIDATNKSKVTLNWQGLENVLLYNVYVKNLLSGSIESFQSNFTSLTISLPIGTPYSWYVSATSAATNETSVSDTWRFYNAGRSVTNYSPFPADVISPLYAQAISGNKVSFSWKGTDIDGDILGYSIYLGTTTTPPLFKANITDMFLNDVPVTSNSTYYWKLTTIDKRGNSAETELFMFTTK